MSALDDARQAVSGLSRWKDRPLGSDSTAYAALAQAEEQRTANLLALATLYPADSGTRADLMAQARKAMGS